MEGLLSPLRRGEEGGVIFKILLVFWALVSGGHFQIVIKDRLLLKNNNKIKKKPKRGWFRSLDDVYVIYAALYTPDMVTGMVHPA